MSARFTRLTRPIELALRAQRGILFGKGLATKAAAGRLQLPHYQEKSALYIPPPTASAKSASESVFQRVIMPELDLDSQLGVGKSLDDKLACFLALQLGLKRRRFQTAFDVAQLRSHYLQIKQLRDQIELLEAKKQEISVQINKLIKSAKQKKLSKEQLMQTDEFKRLHESGNGIKLDVNKLEEVLIPLETSTYLACLSLPNQLHAVSLLSTQSILFENTDKTGGERIASREVSLLPEVQKDSHLSKYYVGRLAKVEQALVNYFYSKLNQVNQADAKYPVLEHVKSVSMFKSAVIEGCGLEFSDSSRLFNVVNANLPSDGSATPADAEQKQKHHVELLHLTGACSLSSLVLNFVRTQISSKYLPWTVFTNAKSYSPQSTPNQGDHAQSNNFDMLALFEKPSSLTINRQTSSARSETEMVQHFESAATAYMKELTAQINEFIRNGCKIGAAGFLQANDVDKYLIDVLKLIIYLYKDLNLSLKFQLIPSEKLSHNESLSVEVQVLSPLDGKYYAVGSVSLLDDYISQRLQIRVQSESTSSKKPINHAHASMIYARLVNLDQLIGVLTGVSPNEPKSAQKLDNFDFQLPKALEPFFLK